MRAKSLLSIAILSTLLATACDEEAGSPGSDGGRDAAVGDAGGDPSDAGGDEGPGDASVEDPVDGGDRAAALVGVYTANQPTSTPCYVVLFQNSVVEIARVDDDTVTISDGTSGTFTCDVVGDTLDCGPVSGVTPAVQIGPSTYCEWPYTVTATIANVSPGGFHAQVLFATSPSPTTTQCGNTLGVCMGSGGTNFLRFVPSPAQPAAPAKAAVVKRVENL